MFINIAFGRGRGRGTRPSSTEESPKPGTTGQQHQWPTNAKKGRGWILQYTATRSTPTPLGRGYLVRSQTPRASATLPRPTKEDLVAPGQFHDAQHESRDWAVQSIGSWESEPAPQENDEWDTEEAGAPGWRSTMEAATQCDVPRGLSKGSQVFRRDWNGRDDEVTWKSIRPYRQVLSFWHHPPAHRRGFCEEHSCLTPTQVTTLTQAANLRHFDLLAARMSKEYRGHRRHGFKEAYDGLLKRWVPKSQDREWHYLVTSANWAAV